MEIFTQGHVDARKKYGTTALANHWLETLEMEYLDANVVQFMEGMQYLFFATSSAEGRVNVNFKGNQSKRLIKVLDKHRFIFPDFNGNGILHSIGDLQTNPYVGVLVADFTRDIRIKINGKARIIEDPNIIATYLDVFETFDIPRLIEITVDYVIPNCSGHLSVVREEILKMVNDEVS